MDPAAPTPLVEGGCWMAGSGVVAFYTVQVTHIL